MRISYTNGSQRLVLQLQPHDLTYLVERVLNNDRILALLTTMAELFTAAASVRTPVPSATAAPQPMPQAAEPVSTAAITEHTTGGLTDIADVWKQLKKEEEKPRVKPSKQTESH